MGQSLGRILMKKNMPWSHTFYMTGHGYPLTKSMAKAYAWAIAKRVGIGDCFNSEIGLRVNLMVLVSI